MPFTPPVLPPFAQHLVAAGLLVEAQVRELCDQARAEEMALSTYLESKKWISSSMLAEAMSQFLGLPLYNIDAHQTEKMPVEFMTLDIVQKGLAIPLLRKQNILILGVADPELMNLSEIAFATGMQIQFIIVEGNKLRSLISDMREAQMIAGLENIGESMLANLDVTAYAEEPSETVFSEGVDDKPIVTYVNQLLMEAIKVRASDIHFEPFDKYMRVRFRIDGLLHETSRSPTQTAGSLVARLKVMANLDIAEHRLPQDGRFKITLAKNKLIDFRISTCPTIYGEKVVVRILDPESTPLDISSLGMDEKQTEVYLKAVKEPQGIILVTGPTGSGKTVTLYTAMKLLNSIQKNICTVEDPIEIYMPGINQVHMNTKTGLTFAKAMRAFLRQDPDIIMVGEIRDLETADIATKAAQTGHLVLSTIHTNNAAMTIIRLANIGLQTYNIASTLTLIVAQRLVRKLCKHCKKVEKISPEILKQSGFAEADLKCTIYGPGKCSKCTHGYKGRAGVFEVMPITVPMRELIMKNGDALQIETLARQEGVISLREATINKIKAGVTSLEELNRVIASTG